MTGFRVRPRPTALVAYWGYGDVDGDWYTKPSGHYRKIAPLVSQEEADRAVGSGVLTGTEGGDVQKARGRYYLYLRQNGLWTKAVTGFDPEKDRKRLDPYCPVRNVSPEYPPTLLIHGREDTDVPCQLSRDMARELARHKVPHDLIEVPGAEHGLAGGDRKLVNQAHDKSLAFIRKHLRPEKPDSRDEKFPPELVRFVPSEKNPVFTAAGKGAWDARIRERGWILREGEVWKMWYTGYDSTRDGLKKLGYATSPDGITWTRYPHNPLYAEHWVEDMMVVKHGGKYHMFAEGKDDQAHRLVSDDGIAWKRVGPLDIRLTDGRPIPPGPYGTPTAWHENDQWHLFYERGDQGIWLATSKDMKIWTNVQDKPVLSPGPAAYDRDLVALNQIIKHKERYYAYYHGSASTGPQARLWSTAVATSTDLVHWEKYPGNPLRPVAENKSSGIVVHDGKHFRLYTMHDAVHLHFPRR
jgi:hypothetical protein